MISVFIECRDQERELAATLSALVAGAIDGLVADVVVIDRGSRDRTHSLADQAGCRLLRDPDLPEAVRAARGEWLLLIEPGARPLIGWIGLVGQHIAVSDAVARFAPSREYRLPFFSRIRRKASALEHGVLMPKRRAIANARPGGTLESLARGLAMKTLKCEIVPASMWVEA